MRKLLKNKMRIFTLLFSFGVLLLLNFTYFKTYSDRIIDFASDPDYIESGISGSTVYVNDLDSDYYYYMGLNYTSNDGTIPTKENKNIYNDSNLVQVKITYDSTDENGNDAYVSLSERQNKYIYFKTYYVNNNSTEDNSDDYIDILLIDNPFTDRPNNKGFNGWITNYSGAKISYDSVYYERWVKVPVTYENDRPKKIDITFNASWTQATTYLTNGSLNSINSNIKSRNMIEINNVINIYSPYNMNGYYKKVTVSRNSYLSGYYDETGDSYSNWDYCNRWSSSWNGSSCVAYDLIDEDENYTDGTDYYELSNNSMSLVDPDSLGITVTQTINPEYDINLSGYYELLSLTYNESQDGYYDNQGNILSGTCNSSSCDVYHLLQYYDDAGNQNRNDANKKYYYLVTRDTNIVVVNNNITNATLSTSSNYPFTITGLNNKNDYNTSITFSGGINIYDDIAFENLEIKTSATVSSTGAVDPTNSTSSRNLSGVLLVRFNNLKMGRTIRFSSGSFTLKSIIGGNNSSTGSNNNPTKNKIIIEGGMYASISLANGGRTGNGNYSLYLNTKAIYGSDYDRVNNDNEKLIVTYCAAGSWGDKIYGNTNSTVSSDVSFDLTVKSGSFGTNKYDLSTGIYVGGRYGGTQYAVRKVTVEGGYIYNLIGGPISASNRTNYNDIYIYMTGGSVDMITGGAGTSATYGNRIIQITGGTVNYSVFGGSNGQTGSSGDGTLNGSTYVYIGGNSVIGDETLVSNNSTLWGAEAGSVFGNGNGNTSAATIGSCDNATIIIDENAIINRNVYGGGNHGATGISSTSSSSTTTIVMNNGIVKGSLFGGGNQNGAGSDDKTAYINIEMNNGIIVGSLYGGSNIEGIIYGPVNINMTGGEISNSLYGGGKGGQSSDSDGTFVKNSINIVVGSSESRYTPIINSGVYGGSAYGLVNGVASSDEVSSDGILVTINKGIINNVFGGGQGDETYVPYVLGNIKVVVNDGTINNVFGANDKNGIPNGNIEVYINGGEITKTFGGGNETGAKTTNVYLNGGTSTNVFGGSNLVGQVTTANVTCTGGKSNAVYGGNNEGGTTGTTNVTVNGGEIDVVYGGGEQTSVTSSTNTNINSYVPKVFGGSNKNGDIPLANVNLLENATTDNVYGGNNEGGQVEKTVVNVNGIYHSNVYGGGLKAFTTETNINAYSGGINNLYGGGSEAGATTTHVNLGSSIINNVYGGSNLSGNVENSYIQNIDDLGINDGIVVTPVKSQSSQSSSEYTSSVNIGVTITNNSSINVSTWDLYLYTSDSVIGADWSSATISEISDGFLINEINKYYGTNPISSNQSYTFDFHAFTNTNYDDYQIYGYYFVGKDESGNVVTSQNKINNIYGGNNEGGSTNTTNITLTRGLVDYIYGGGNKATTTTTNVDITNVNVNSKIFGGGNEASVDNANLSIHSSTIGSESNTGYVFGGGNNADIIYTANLNINNNSNIYGYTFGGGNLGKVNESVIFNIENSNVSNEIYGAGNMAQVGSGEDNNSVTLTVNNVNCPKLYGAGNAANTLGNVTVNITSSTISEVYGAGNGEHSVVAGDVTGEDNPAKVNGNIYLNIESTTSDNIYGGGNLGFAEKSTYVNAKNITLNDSIYGGGNASRVKDNTYLYISGGTINGSVYAGGNGVQAIVEGNTNLDIDNSANIVNHVFGGGNAAATGTKDNDNSQGVVNIAGATIGKNVYGGANTSVLYGTTNVNIGINKVTTENLIASDIVIGGTVFGGGEANASGSEVYDFTFISVTKGMDINIDGLNHNVLTIEGSIFGSGNASSTKGFSNINIFNYGTSTNIKKNVSIQRASKVVIDNSYILLSGAKDRTNEYSDVLFSLSRIDDLVLKNSSSLYLKTGANLLKKFESLTANDEKASVTIDEETGSVTKNVNNRLYMLVGKNLNIATNENVTEYGDVSGMTFFGMFSLDRNDNVVTALYGDYANNEVISSGDIYYFTSGSYVLGKHLTNHDITVDGFYSNYGKEDNSIEIKYIEPTPADASFYMWTIGEVVASYEITLSASKYSTLGAQEVPLINHASANTTFSILGVNFSNLDENIQLVDYNEIKRVARTDEEADTIFGLNMKSSSSGWLTNGNTNFITSSDVNITGTKDYIRENNNYTPGFVFYLYHSKNLKTAGSMGSVTISLVAITPIDDLNNNVERINININLTKALYNTNDYEGTITPGKNYEMFPTSPTSITTKSSFSTYYSLYMESDTNPYQTGYSRSLVSTYVYPENTKLTMIDLHDKSNPVYYYYVITQSDYNNALLEYSQYGEVSYKLSKFIKMGSTSADNNYSDEVNNALYYDSENKTADEEFIFIVDFLESNITEDVLDKTLLLELRNAGDQTLISVLGIQQQTLKYNLYLTSDTYIDLTGTISKNNIYTSESALMTVTTNFEEHDNVKDTTYGDEKLGVKISIYDSNNTLLSGQDLMGLKFTYKGTSYFPNSKGETRIKISDKVANTLSYITLDTGTSQIASGSYKIVLEAFGSFDGIYYGTESLKKIEFNVNFIDSPYGLKISTNSNFMFIDKTTGKNFIDTQNYPLKIEYTSNLENPNIRIKLMRRKYDTIYSMEYEDVGINDYIQNGLRASSNPYEYYLIENPTANMDYTFIMKENLISGTYKIVVSLYDSDVFIGSVYDYIIIK